MFQFVKDYKKKLFERHLFLGVWQAGLAAYFQHLHSKGEWHWIWTIGLIVAGVVAEHEMDRYMAWERLRYGLYQSSQWLDLHPTRPKRTVLVLIGDEEYWKGELGRRVPIRRDYLAKLLDAIDKGEPELIVLDFNLQSPVPGSASLEHAQYVEETQKLINSIRGVSSRRKIVLPATTKSEDETHYEREPTVLDGNNFDSRRVGEGDISLPDDMRQIPLTLHLENGTSMDSLASAVVRFTDKRALDEAEGERGDALPYGTYIDPNKFARFTSTHILNTEADMLKSELGCKIVIVAGAWHKDAYGQGEQADVVLTPAGRIGGQFAHANYIEALLDSRTLRPLADWQKILFGVVLSLLAAGVIASPWRVRTRLLTVVALAFLPLVISYFLRQNLGTFFDSLLPIAMLLLHWLGERIIS
jgi:CHASE2 domain-containing sensor protein